MSFSSDVKAELCRCEIGSRACAVAEGYGILLYCNTFSPNGVRIITGSVPFSRRVGAVFSRAFGVEFDSRQRKDEGGKLILTIGDEKKLRKLHDAIGYDPAAALAHYVNLGILEDENTKESFIRGAFLAGGSVTDPMKRYHLEFVTDHYGVSREMFSLLLEMGFDPKAIQRGGNYITYFKQSTAIEDILTTMGAPVAAMDIMSAKIEKDMNNSVNRKVNCDTANVAKTVAAAGEQLEAIKALKESGEFVKLPEKIREAGEMRLKNPELTLSQLAQEFDPPLSKSCLVHRLRKITETAKKL